MFTEVADFSYKMGRENWISGFSKFVPTQKRVRKIEIWNSKKIAMKTLFERKMWKLCPRKTFLQLLSKLLLKYFLNLFFDFFLLFFEKKKLLWTFFLIYIETFLFKLFWFVLFETFVWNLFWFLLFEIFFEKMFWNIFWNFFVNSARKISWTWYYVSLVIQIKLTKIRHFNQKSKFRWKLPCFVRHKNCDRSILIDFSQYGIRKTSELKLLKKILNNFLVIHVKFGDEHVGNFAAWLWRRRLLFLPRNGESDNFRFQRRRSNVKSRSPLLLRHIFRKWVRHSY